MKEAAQEAAKEEEAAAEQSKDEEWFVLIHVAIEAAAAPALGAIVRVTAGGRTQARAALSQTSYYSHDDLRMHFGLGSAAGADTIEVRWPSGRIDTLHDVRGGRVVTIKEGTPISLHDR